jgi:hypothetical protein
MTSSRGSGFPFAKIVVVLALAFIAGIGLCGLDYFLASQGIGKSTQEFGVGPLDAVSLVVMVLSLAALVLMLIAWAISAAVGGFSRGAMDTQKPFDEKDDNDLKR